MAEVAILILNWKRYQDTRECLDSVRALEVPPEPSVYVIDQESDPSQLSQLLTLHPGVIPLPLEGNLGFAGGMNHGIRRALGDGARYVVLLNNDARLTPPVLRQLLALFKSHLKVGIAGPSLRSLPPGEKVVAIGMDVNRWSGRVTLRHHGELPENLYPYPHQVDAISGACLMVSAEVLEQIGLLQEDYFFYFEDVDLCLRAREQGWNVYCAPTSVVYHEGGATMGQHPDRIYYGVRNQLRVIAERGLAMSTPMAWGRSLFIAGLNAAAALRQEGIPPWTALGSLAQGVSDHRRRRYGRRAQG